MATVVGVRFKNAGKLYYFDPGKLWPAAGSYVVVETARGVEYGQVITGVRQVDDELIASPLKQVLRIATEGDARHAARPEKYAQHLGRKPETAGRRAADAAVRRRRLRGVSG